MTLKEVSDITGISHGRVAKYAREAGWTIPSKICLLSSEQAEIIVKAMKKLKQKKYSEFLANLNPCQCEYDKNAVQINVRGKKILLDREDLERVLAVGLWHISSKTYYVRHIRLNRKVISLHRFLLNAPETMTVDHISGDTLDNRKVNLRICTKQNNSCNRKLYINNTSGYKGVCYRKDIGKWRASIDFNNKRIRLGYFNTPEEAHTAYCEASKKYHGEFGRIA